MSYSFDNDGGGTTVLELAGTRRTSEIHHPLPFDGMARGDDALLLPAGGVKGGGGGRRKLQGEGYPTPQGAAHRCQLCLEGDGASFVEEAEPDQP